MIKIYSRFLLILLFLCSNVLLAQKRNLWSTERLSGLNSSELKSVENLKKFKSYTLELSALKKELEGAPNSEIYAGPNGKKVMFPTGDGQLMIFRVKESSVMSAGLAKKYPSNKSYVGISEKDASKRIRFSVNELGLHAVILDVKKGAHYIEPVGNNKNKYKVFYRSDVEAIHEFECFTSTQEAAFKSDLLKAAFDDGILRTYKLALAATGEYSQFHINEQGANGATDAQKKAIVLAAMTTAMTQVNAIYEKDLAVTMKLIDNNDELIYLDPDTDPYSNFDADELLDENQENCDLVIGTDNYDIGHVFSTGGGGVATLGAVCQSGFKARGVTGLPNPIGEYFYYDFVAHEMGHQFGANHSFNGDDGGCAGNRNSQTAVETGSGSSLMSYAGLCSSQNVQGSVDPYFHIISIDEIRKFVESPFGASCAIETDLILNQNAPVADAGEDFMLPIGTPFRLEGVGTDADGDILTYSWEQVDNEITTVPPSSTSTSGALYKSHLPSLNSNRYMPKMNTLVNGEISSKWEVTPTVAREMNFKFTVRDNNIEAGQVGSDDLRITVTDAAGPFVVTSQNVEDLVWTMGEQETITWDVAGTDGNGVNVSNVNILLSTDWGKTFSTVLAANVPNDGMQIITVPEFKASQCFIMIEAIGNRFIALNSKSFSIGEFNEVCTISKSSDTPLAIPDNNREGVTSVINIADDVRVENIAVSFVTDDGQPGIEHSYLGDITILLESPEGTVIQLLSKSCDASEDIQATFSDLGDVNLLCRNFSPGISGTKKPLEEFANFNGESAQGNWILTVIDDEAADTGTLESWSLEVCSSEAVLGVNNYVFEDFTVFPNPSDGNFKVRFKSDELGDVDILIYDILGRKVVEKTFKNASNRFEEEMDLGSVSGGIYLLSVKRGNKMSSHKLRIK